MRQNIERKGRNPRITVCYTPDENEKIIKLATACGLKKSQYIHDFPWARAKGNDERQGS